MSINVSMSHLFHLILKNYSVHTPPQERSSDKNLLQKSSPKLKQYGERAFSFAGADVWNSLPTLVKSSPSVDIFQKREPIMTV